MNQRKQLLAIVNLMLLVHFASAQPMKGTEPSIIRLDKRMDKLVPADARLETIADGIAWAEGPVWNRKGNCLLFSDVPNNSILKWTKAEGLTLYYAARAAARYRAIEHGVANRTKRSA